MLSFQSYRLNIQEKALWTWAPVRCNWEKGLWETCWFSEVLSQLRPEGPRSNIPAVDSLFKSNAMLFDFYQARGRYQLVICFPTRKTWCVIIRKKKRGLGGALCYSLLQVINFFKNFKSNWANPWVKKKTQLWRLSITKTSPLPLQVPELQITQRIL